MRYWRLRWFTEHDVNKSLKKQIKALREEMEELKKYSIIGSRLACRDECEFLDKRHAYCLRYRTPLGILRSGKTEQFFDCILGNEKPF